MRLALFLSMVVDVTEVSFYKYRITHTIHYQANERSVIAAISENGKFFYILCNNRWENSRNCLIGIISNPYWCFPDTLISFQVMLHNFCNLVTKSLKTLLSQPFKEVFISRYFYHKENIEKSAYMLINNSALKEAPDLVSRIEAFFIEQYEYFE